MRAINLGRIPESHAKVNLQFWVVLVGLKIKAKDSRKAQGWKALRLIRSLTLGDFEGSAVRHGTQCDTPNPILSTHAGQRRVNSELYFVVPVKYEISTLAELVAPALFSCCRPFGPVSASLKYLAAAMTLTARLRAARAFPPPALAAAPTRLPVSASGRRRGKVETRLLTEALLNVDDC